MPRVRLPQMRAQLCATSLIPAGCWALPDARAKNVHVRTVDAHESDDQAVNVRYSELFAAQLVSLLIGEAAGWLFGTKETKRLQMGCSMFQLPEYRWPNMTCMTRQMRHISD